MTQDQFISIVRAVAKYGGGALAAKGWVDGSMTEGIVSGAVIVATAIWGAYHQENKIAK